MLVSVSLPIWSLYADTWIMVVVICCILLVQECSILHCCLCPISQISKWQKTPPNTRINIKVWTRDSLLISNQSMVNIIQQTNYKWTPVSTSDMCFPTEVVRLSVGMVKEANCFQSYLNFLLFVALWLCVCPTPSLRIPRSERLNTWEQILKIDTLRELPTYEHPHPESKELQT